MLCAQGHGHHCVRRMHASPAPAATPAASIDRQRLLLTAARLHEQVPQPRPVRRVGGVQRHVHGPHAGIATQQRQQLQQAGGQGLGLRGAGPVLIVIFTAHLRLGLGVREQPGRDASQGSSEARCRAFARRLFRVSVLLATDGGGCSSQFVLKGMQCTPTGYTPTDCHPHQSAGHCGSLPPTVRAIRFRG